MRILSFCVTALALLLPVPALAYIGPGMGAGAIAVVLGVIGSVFLAIVAVVWYPAKRLMKSFKSAKNPESTSAISNELDTDNSAMRDPDRDRGPDAARDSGRGD